MAGILDYGEVQKYATLYTFQELLIQQQRRALEAMTATIGILKHPVHRGAAGHGCDRTLQEGPGVT
jgi:hypothetical protein